MFHKKLTAKELAEKYKESRRKKMTRTIRKIMWKLILKGLYFQYDWRFRHEHMGDYWYAVTKLCGKNSPHVYAKISPLGGLTFDIFRKTTSDWSDIEREVGKYMYKVERVLEEQQYSLQQ